MLGMAIKVILLSLWLPVLVLLVSVVGFGGKAFTDTPEPIFQLATFFALSLPYAVPLTWAVVLLHRRSRIAAWICGVILVPATVFTLIAGGVLGLLLTVVAVVIVSLPAWATLLVMRRQQG